MIESTLKIARYCPLVIQGFSNFLGLFQGIMANPDTTQDTLPETNSEFAPKNGWLEFDPFLLKRPIFRGELLVSGRVNSFHGQPII